MTKEQEKIIDSFSTKEQEFREAMKELERITRRADSLRSERDKLAEKIMGFVGPNIETKYVSVRNRHYQICHKHGIKEIEFELFQ